MRSLIAGMRKTSYVVISIEASVKRENFVSLLYFLSLLFSFIKQSLRWKSLSCSIADEDDDDDEEEEDNEEEEEGRQG